MKNKKPLAKAVRAIKQGASIHYRQDTLSSLSGQGDVHRKNSATLQRQRPQSRSGSLGLIPTIYAGSKSAVRSWRVKLWFFVTGWIKNTYAVSDKPGASQIVDCCLGIEEGLLNDK